MAIQLRRRFNSPSLGASVVDGFRQFRQEALLCDVQLIVGRQEFDVHRTYLASRSDYFFKLFNAKEKGQSQVEIKEVSAGTLSTVLDYLYSGDVVINDANLKDVTEAAHYFRLHDLMSFCAVYVKEELTTNNCIIPCFKLSDKYNLDCRREITEFIANNFEAVGRSDQFQYLPGELLVEVLSSDSLVASTEMEVFRIVLTWLEGNQSRQPDIIRELLGRIRYGLMTGDEMADVMALSAFKREDCSDVLKAATQYHMRLFSQPILSPSLSRMRDCKDCLVVMGAGYSEDTLNEHVLAAPMRDDFIGDWVCLNPTTRPRFASAAAVMNDFVFLAGGKIVRSIDESHASDKALRYNPRGGQWLQLSSMTVPRANFVLLALQSCLIAVGGRHREGPLDSVERYDIASNEWSLIPASLPGALFGHAGCSIGSRAFISGGFSSDVSSPDVLSFDLARSTWERLASMNHSRGYHAMVPHGNRLFVCGGTSSTGYQRQDVLGTESYDIQTDSWTELSRQRQCHSQAPAVSSGSAIFVVGGYDWGTSTTVSSYDIERDSWEVHGRNIPQSVTGGVAFHLRLPRKLLIASATVNT